MLQSTPGKFTLTKSLLYPQPKLLISGPVALRCARRWERLLAPGKTGPRSIVPSSIILITLRNAQVRRISWVRGVRPVRGRYEWPPHDAAPDRPPLSLIAIPQRVRRNAKGALHPGRLYASYERVGFT